MRWEHLGLSPADAFIWWKNISNMRWEHLVGRTLIDNTGWKNISNMRWEHRLREGLREAHGWKNISNMRWEHLECRWLSTVLWWKNISNMRWEHLVFGGSEDEGFEEHINDSYCYKESGQVVWQKRCFRKHNGYDRYDMLQNIYIFPNGIGVDTDYDCGGNNSNVFWLFDGRSFEEVYDKMVDYINDHK